MLQETTSSVLKVINHINKFALTKINEDCSVTFRYSSHLLVENVMKFVESEKLSVDIINTKPSMDYRNIKGMFTIHFNDL
jgi:hypothetical protein